MGGAKDDDGATPDAVLEGRGDPRTVTGGGIIARTTDAGRKIIGAPRKAGRGVVIGHHGIVPSDWLGKTSGSRSVENNNRVGPGGRPGSRVGVVCGRG